VGVGTSAATLMIMVGAARIEVRSGFDHALLRTSHQDASLRSDLAIMIADPRDHDEAIEAITMRGIPTSTTRPAATARNVATAGRAATARCAAAVYGGVSARVAEAEVPEQRCAAGKARQGGNRHDAS
jgi:hypothetical protein